MQTECPHWFFPELNGKSFVLFNDSRLSGEPVTDADLEFVNITGNAVLAAKSATWSSGAYWFFVVRENDIMLLNTGNAEGVLCRKKSWRFIEAFLDAPLKFR